MANYIGFTRSNYFRVTDPDTLKKIIKAIMVDREKWNGESALKTVRHITVLAHMSEHITIIQIVQKPYSTIGKDTFNTRLHSVIKSFNRMI